MRSKSISATATFVLDVLTSSGIADTGSEFVEWAGDCTGLSACEVTMDEARTVNAAFDEEPVGLTDTLSLIKGGYAEGGTVTSDPAGIGCGPACDAQMAQFAEGETVTLIASAEEGHAFAGWLNCKYVSAYVCEVTLDGPLTEVTAVFVKDGENGEDGEDGAQGPPGEDGAQGPAGQDGQNGSNGSNGSQGVPGVLGVPGVSGLPGAQGQRGPAGRVKVICKVKQKGKKRPKVTCRVAQAKAKKSARLKWRLMSHGRVRAHGRTNAFRLQRILNGLRPGGYVLQVRGQKPMRIFMR